MLLGMLIVINVSGGCNKNMKIMLIIAKFPGKIISRVISRTVVSAKHSLIPSTFNILARKEKDKALSYILRVPLAIDIYAYIFLPDA